MADPSRGATPSAAPDVGAAPSLPTVDVFTEAEAWTLFALVELLCTRTHAEPCRPGQVVAEIDRSLGAVVEDGSAMPPSAGVAVVLHGPDGTSRSLPPQPSTLEVYLRGLSALDRIALERHGACFSDVAEDGRRELVFGRGKGNSPAVQGLVDAVRLRMAQSSSAPLVANERASVRRSATLVGEGEASLRSSGERRP